MRPFGEEKWLLFALVKKKKTPQTNKQKKLPKTKLKGSELVALVGMISRHLGIDCVMWLSMVTLIQIYNEKEQAELGKYKMDSWRSRRVPGSVVKSSAEPAKYVKISSALKGMKGGVASGKDSSQRSF